MTPAERQETMDRVIAARLNGCTLKESAGAAGLAPSTLYEWKNTFPEFSERLKLARFACRAECVDAIKKDKSWQSKAWILERLCPQAWGKKDVELAKKLLAEHGLPLFPTDPAEQMKVIRTLEAAAQKKLNGKAA